jgi:hypothetical protein
MREIADASMQATESTVDVTPPQAATKNNGGNGRWNGGMADGMVEWQEWWEWPNVLLDQHENSFVNQIAVLFC